MSNTETVLAQHPYIAILTSVFGFVTPFITSILPIFQLIVLILSIWLTVLTIEAKLKERNTKKKRHEKNSIS